MKTDTDPDPVGSNIGHAMILTAILAGVLISSHNHSLVGFAIATLYAIAVWLIAVSALTLTGAVHHARSHQLPAAKQSALSGGLGILLGTFAFLVLPLMNDARVPIFVNIMNTTTLALLFLTGGYHLVSRQLRLLSATVAVAVIMTLLFYTIQIAASLHVFAP